MMTIAFAIPENKGTKQSIHTGMIGSMSDNSMVSPPFLLPQLIGAGEMVKSCCQVLDIWSISLEKALSMIRRSTSIVIRIVTFAAPETNGTKQLINVIRIGSISDSSMISPSFIPAGQGVFAWGGFSPCPYRVLLLRISQSESNKKGLYVFLRNTRGGSYVKDM